MTWTSGAMLPTAPAPLHQARRLALTEARHWHYASVSAGVLYLLTDAASWWLIFMGMTMLASLALNRYARLRAASVAAYGGGHAH